MPGSPTIDLPRVDDFDLTTGAPQWSAAVWHAVPAVPPSVDDPAHRTRVRAVWSATGIYVGFDCRDDRQVTTGLPDGGDLWDQDVVEAFFQPDERVPLYLEYELSPAGSELLLLVPNRDGQFMGWGPWHYEGTRRSRRAVRTTTGQDWAAEFFLPFELFKGVGPVPPARGDVWRVNFCRIDHDRGTPALFSWSPGVESTFHVPDRFGRLRFT